MKSKDIAELKGRIRAALESSTDLDGNPVPKELIDEIMDGPDGDFELLDDAEIAEAELGPDNDATRAGGVGPWNNIPMQIISGPQRDPGIQQFSAEGGIPLQTIGSEQDRNSGRGIWGGSSSGISVELQNADGDRAGNKPATVGAKLRRHDQHWEAP